MGLTAVHQVLAGAAPRDAITNHALQARDLFRSWGLTSEVFAGATHPGLAGDVHPAAAYPSRTSPDDTAVLHYSIDSPAFSIAADHSRRLLMHYHNITPAELLWAHTPYIALECAVGRRRLASYVDRVVGSCADSGFNADELAAFGFQKPAVTGILRAPIDLPPPLPARPPGPTRLLFVGRGIANKAQHHVILALAALYEAGHEAELTFVGGWDAAPEYRAECRSLARDLGLAGSVHFAGSVDDRQLGVEYRAADLFVCLSDHEGFCVPLLEAMEAGLPIVAYNAGAVGETIGRGGLVLEQKTPGLVAAAIIELMENTNLRDACRSDQGRTLRRLGHDQVSGRLRAFLDGHE